MVSGHENPENPEDRVIVEYTKMAKVVKDPVGLEIAEYTETVEVVEVPKDPEMA